MQPSRLPSGWPNKDRSRALQVGRLRFWLIDTGPPPDAPAAPVLLLLHGTGASGHSFHRTIPALSRRYRLIVPDLPGQGCTASPGFRRLGLDDMAKDLWALCDALGIAPLCIIGHSAGAAIGLRMAELRPIPCGVIGLNAALSEFDGAAGFFFPLLARGLARMPLAASAISALSGRPGAVDRILAGTGSPLDPISRAMYLRLVRDADHVTGTLGMMAQWRLQGLMARLPQMESPVWLIASEGDRAVPAQVSADAARRMPNCQLVILPKLGHLAHEEAEDGLSGVIGDCLAQCAASKDHV